MGINDIEKIESIISEEVEGSLIKLGFEKNQIKRAFKKDEYEIDMILFDSITFRPLICFEFKPIINRMNILMTVKKLRRFYEKNLSIEQFILCGYNKGKVIYYDLTTIIKANKENITDDIDDIVKDGKNVIPVKINEITKSINRKRKRQKIFKNIRANIRFMLIFMAELIIIIFIMLDGLGKYQLNTERLILIGLLVGIMLMPTIKSFNAGGFGFVSRDPIDYKISQEENEK